MKMFLIVIIQLCALLVRLPNKSAKYEIIYDGFCVLLVSILFYLFHLYLVSILISDVLIPYVK